MPASRKVKLDIVSAQLVKIVIITILTILVLPSSASGDAGRYTITPSDGFPGYPSVIDDFMCVENVMGTILFALWVNENCDVLLFNSPAPYTIVQNFLGPGGQWNDTNCLTTQVAVTKDSAANTGGVGQANNYGKITQFITSWICPVVTPTPIVPPASNSTTTSTIPTSSSGGGGASIVQGIMNGESHLLTILVPVAVVVAFIFTLLGWLWYKNKIYGKRYFQRQPKVEEIELRNFP